MPSSPSFAGASPQATLISAAGVSLVQRQSRPRRPQPPLQPWVFREERERAFARDAASGIVLLDRSRELHLPGPGTTPSLLAAYLVVRSGEEVRSSFEGGLEFYFVIHGQGTSCWEGGCVSWEEGDVFFLPGGKDVAHHAMSDSRLYVLSDQPLARFLGLGPKQSTVHPLHYSGRDIRNAQALEYQNTGKSGVLHFGCDADIVYSSFVPTWKWLRPGENQLRHRHAAVAVQLFVAGEDSTSTIGDQRLKWENFVVCVTPAGWLHSHQNDGDDVAAYIVAQDLPLYRYLRTYWHEEPDTGIRLQDWLGS